MSQQDTQSGELELQAIHARLGRGDERMSRIEAQLDENTAATKRVEENTADLIESFRNLSGLWNSLSWLAKAAKPFLAVGASIAAMWAAWKSGIGPR